MELGRTCLAEWGYVIICCVSYQSRTCIIVLRRVCQIHLDRRSAVDQNQPIAEDHSHWTYWPLAEPQQRSVKICQQSITLRLICGRFAEHCLVGIKGNPQLNRNIDCDVIMAEVRETSRKPDEIYNLLERLAPGARKLEIFGRMHNTRPGKLDISIVHFFWHSYANCTTGWTTLGNQLEGSRIADPAMLLRVSLVFCFTPILGISGLHMPLSVQKGLPRRARAIYWSRPEHPSAGKRI